MPKLQKAFKFLPRNYDRCTRSNLSREEWIQFFYFYYNTIAVAD